MKSDIELIKEIQNNINVNKNYQLLFSKYENYIYSKSHYISKTYNYSIDAHEIAADLQWWIYHRVPTIRINKIKDITKFNFAIFLNLAFLSCKREYREKCFENSKLVSFDYTEEELKHYDKYSDFLSKKMFYSQKIKDPTFNTVNEYMIYDNIKEYISKFKGNTKNILLLLFQGYRPKEIAVKLKISIPAIHSIIKKHQSAIMKFYEV